MNSYKTNDLGIKSIKKVKKVSATLFCTTLDNLQNDTFFTLKPFEYPKDSQVYTKDFYCREEKKYCISNYSNTSEKLCKGDKVVYINFEF